MDPDLKKFKKAKPDPEEVITDIETEKKSNKFKVGERRFGRKAEKVLQRR